MEKPNKLQGLIATVLFHGTLLFMLLAFKLYQTYPPIVIPEGLTVNFGTDAEGLGDIEPAPLAGQPAEVKAAVVKPAATPPTPKAKPVKARVTERAPDLLTSEKEAGPALKKQDNAKDLADKIKLDEKKKIEKEEKEQARQAEIERQRVEAEQKHQADLENQRIEAEKKKQEQQQGQLNAIKGRMGKSFGGNAVNGGTGGEGNTQGTGNQGDPTGSVDSKNRGPGGGKGAGISFSLDGRSVYGSLAKPEYGVNEYGDVVVMITVNKEGDVIDAKPGAKGTTTTNSTLWEAARKAAMSAKFNRVSNAEAPVYQKGTITYHFKLL